MSGASVVKVKISTANNNIIVRPVQPAVSRVAVSTRQNLVKAGVSVSGPRGPQGPPGTGGDLNFTQSFTSTTSVTVNHNLGKYPSVTVIDSAGDECEGLVDHISVNSLTVSFSAAFSGTVICN